MVDDLDFNELMEDPPIENSVMPFGVYAGKTLGQIAATDKGLLYLDWAAGVWKDGFGDTVRQFMADEIMQQEVERVLEEKE